jgi:hypothetical protein
MPVMTPNPKPGYLAKLAFGATAGVDQPVDFLNENMVLNANILDPAGLRGTVAHAASRKRHAGRLASGDILMQPSAVEWSYLLPKILGGVPAGTSYPLAEQLPAYYTALLRGETMFIYSGCRANSATITATKGATVQLTLNSIAVDRTKAPGAAFPPLTLDNVTQPLILEDLVVTINGNTIDCFEMTLSINNFVIPRQVNSQTATAVYRTDRVISWDVLVPWGDDETLIDLAVGGVAILATFTYGGTSLSFSSPKVCIPPRDPPVAGREEITNRIIGDAGFNATPGDELIVTLDSTP